MIIHKILFNVFNITCSDYEGRLDKMDSYQITHKSSQIVNYIVLAGIILLAIFFAVQ